MKNPYILIDLERSIRYGFLYYWKPNKNGYTTYLSESGVYPEEVARKIEREDVDKRTVAVSLSVIHNIAR